MANKREGKSDMKSIRQKQANDAVDSSATQAATEGRQSR